MAIEVGSFATGGEIAEKFITGPEFTTFIVGSYDQPNELVYYAPVERYSHLHCQIMKISFLRRLWEIYENETNMPQQGNFMNAQISCTGISECYRNKSPVMLTSLSG